MLRNSRGRPSANHVYINLKKYGKGQTRPPPFVKRVVSICVRARGSMKNSGRQRPTILIVEDMDWIRAGMKKAVEQEGYHAVEATNDTEALQLAEREPPELIVTEEELPTFAALMARLRKHATLSNIPVVIINPDVENCARHGVAYLLPDYADITSLLAVLRY